MPVSRIDLDKCIGCGTCVESCPMDVFRLDTLADYRKEHAPCSLACPLGVRQREYHDLVAMGMVEEAAEIMRICHPMPAITGRLCPHPCESECARTKIDKAVNIIALERYLGDWLLQSEPPAAGAGNDGRVAIIGSGPAGMAAAYFLALDGFSPTVFEKGPKLGGLLRTAVPSFRVPEQVLDAQFEFYRAMGISFRSGVRVGVDVTVEELRAFGYAAVIAATGASRPVELSVPGGEADGIVSAMEFLETAKITTPGGLGAVAIVGGGNVALDAARTALRLGAAPVHVVCLERSEPGLKDSMLAPIAEIDEAVAEGVVIHPSRGVHSFAVEDDHVNAIRCVECLSVREEDGRFSPVYGDCVLPERIEARTVVLAIGQVAAPTLVPAGFPTGERDLISVDPATAEVAPGLFACGDAVSGPSTVVEALAAGKRAAVAVGRYLRGEAVTPVTGEEPVRAAEPPKEKIETTSRVERRSRPAAERRGDCAEVTLGFTQAQAQVEAGRCLTCGSRSKIAYLDDCQVCRLCEHYCPTDAIDISEGVLLGSLLNWNVVELGR